MLEYIYGSPQTSLVRRSFAINASRDRNLVSALAHLGYVTVALDAPGTPYREGVRGGDQGNFTAGIADHAAAIRRLCERHSWMDAGSRRHLRLVDFATAALMLEPDTYHAAVAGESGTTRGIACRSRTWTCRSQTGRRTDAATIQDQAHRLRRPLMIINGTRYKRDTRPCAADDARPDRCGDRPRVRARPTRTTGSEVRKRTTCSRSTWRSSDAT